jgi:alcohol sulfotransferase
MVAMRCDGPIRFASIDGYSRAARWLCWRGTRATSRSRYFHLKHRSHNPGRQRLASQPLEEFVWTDSGGIPSIVRYLNLWAQWSRERGDILILRYEDFVDRPEPTVRALAEFIGLDSSEADIMDAVDFASFDNLKSKEREGYFSSGRMGPGRAGDESSYKVRSGRSGGFRAKLDEQGRLRVSTYVGEHLDPLFGYGG